MFFVVPIIHFICTEKKLLKQVKSLNLVMSKWGILLIIVLHELNTVQNKNGQLTKYAPVKKVTEPLTF